MSIEHVVVRPNEVDLRRRFKVWGGALSIDPRSIRTHKELHFFYDPVTKLRLVIGIYNECYPAALGGIRMNLYEDRFGPITDVLRLSEGMWNKAVISEVEFDGAKAVIWNDPFTEKTPELLHAVGDCIESLSGRYVGGEDLHMYQGDCLTVSERTSHIGGTTSGGKDRVSPDTAYGVVQSILATTEFLRLGRQLGDMAFAVQGAGKVGYHVIKRLVDHGARVFVTEMPDANSWAKAERVKREFGAILIRDLDQFYSLPIDGFIPCAVGGILNSTTISKLRVKFVVGSANNQLLAPEHGVMLHRKGVLYGVDYIANCGGLVHLAHENDGSSDAQVHEHIARIAYTKMLNVYERSSARSLPPAMIAAQMIAERVATLGS